VSQSRLEALFLSQRQPLLRTLQAMVGHPCTAEDLLQDTYLRVSRALAERPVDHLQAFLFQTARNLALDHLRARRLYRQTLIDDVPRDVLHNVAAPASSLEQAICAEQLILQLDLRVAQLTARQQKIFRLSRLQGRSHPQIAAQLQVSVSTVQKELKQIMAICTEVAMRTDDE
jgi:RNA polymerase sigma factor (sigma-70 family)